MFYGREKELAELEKQYRLNGFRFFVLYGRRRVGKTRLLQEFCKGKKTIFHVGMQQTREAALLSFSHDVLAALPSNDAGYFDRFRSWEDAFRYIAKFAAKERIILVMDEYPYIAQTDPSLSSLLQKMIDHEWKEAEIFLVLCGSSMSFMEHQVLGYQSPLYGRRTAQLKVRPMNYLDAARFFAHWNSTDRLYAYGVCGGIPKYLEFFAEYPDFESAVKGEFLSLSGHLAEEPTNLMQQEMREPALYNGILEAIASGKTKQNEIAAAVSKDTKDITAYLKALADLEIIEKRMPIEEENRKKTTYAVSDHMYRFWFRFVPRCMSLIGMDMGNEAWTNIIKPELDAYFGHVFETVCLQYIMEQIRIGQLRPLYLKYGQWWGTDPSTRTEEEIDIVAATNQEILVGECKWREESVNDEVLDQLQKRAELIRRGRTVRYALFSKSGFSDELLSRAEKEDVILVRASDMFANIAES